MVGSQIVLQGAWPLNTCTVLGPEDVELFGPMVLGTSMAANPNAQGDSSTTLGVWFWSWNLILAKHVPLITELFPWSLPFYL